MNITLLGANGKTGTQVVKQALDAGHVVTALVRRPDALKEQANLHVLMGGLDPEKRIKCTTHSVTSAGTN